MLSLHDTTDALCRVASAHANARRQGEFAELRSPDVDTDFDDIVAISCMCYGRNMRERKQQLLRVRLNPLKASLLGSSGTLVSRPGVGPFRLLCLEDRGAE